MSGTWWVSDADLDDDQSVAVQGTSEAESFLIRGPAGSGKTNILLLRAKWFRLKDISDFKIIVFTRTLRDFIREGCEEYGVPWQTVVTSTQFFRELLDEYGVGYETSDNFEADRVLLCGKAQSLIEEKGISNTIEALLVDECQDYLDTELHIFRKLATRLIMAADSRQSIYKSTQTPNLLEKLVNNKSINLKYHYRSGLRICRVADAVLRDSANFAPVKEDCLYDEAARPSSVEIDELPNLDAQFRKIIERLPAQLDAYPGELIGVLFPKREQVSSFQDELARHSFGEEGERVRVDTMHGAKGLEFRAVHLGGCEALYRMGATQKRLIYTAILRAQTAVAIYYTGSVPGYLESAVAKLSPPKGSPRLSDLFKKKS